MRDLALPVEPPVDDGSDRRPVDAVGPGKVALQGTLEVLFEDLSLEAS